MADLLPIIETMEHRWMRAWMERDAKTLKSLTSRKFILLTGSKPPVILDYRSWIDAAVNRYSCRSYRFSNIYTRDFGSIASFAAQLDLESTMDGRDFPGSGIWVVDLWRKSLPTRRWKLVQRTVSRTDEEARLPQAIKSLQLWR